MHSTAKTSRFLIDFSSGGQLANPASAVSRVGLLQHTVVSRLTIAASRQVSDQFVQRLIQLAEHAYGLRDMKTLQETSELLANSPIAGARQIGQYYRALVIKRDGRAEEAQVLFERVADNAPLGYRARAIQTLGVIHHEQGHLDDALRLYVEASRAASLERQPALLTDLLVHLQIPVIKACAGDHQGALEYLERVSPLVRLVANQQPSYFYFYQNALAVELAELGRIAEAEAASAIALASPFAPAYPEWSETREEIAAKRTSATASVIGLNYAPKARPSPKIEPHRQRRQARKRGRRIRLSGKDSFQRSIVPIPATVTNPLSAMSILDRVLSCIRPRAPPFVSESISN
jgi:tetratricopeptide (TPR) repeat protein